MKKNINSISRPINQQKLKKKRVKPCLFLPFEAFLKKFEFILFFYLLQINIFLCF